MRVTAFSSLIKALPEELTTRFVALVLRFCPELPIFPVPEFKVTLVPFAEPDPAIVPVPFAVKIRLPAAFVATALEFKLTLPLLPTCAASVRFPPCTVPIVLITLLAPVVLKTIDAALPVDKVLRLMVPANVSFILMLPEVEVTLMFCAFVDTLLVCPMTPDPEVALRVFVVSTPPAPKTIFPLP